MAYTIDATSCYLNVKDNNSDTFYSFRLGELTSYYDDSNFTITDDVRHIQIPIAEVSTINSGAFTTFADLQTFIRNAQIVCDASGGGGGGGVWGAITGTLSAQTDLQTALNNKQNISLNAYTFRANNTNATANATDHTFKDIAQQTYTGTITWTGTTAPSGATDHSYRWSQVGKLVTLRLTLIYASAGTALTSVVCSLPTDCPTPEGISGSSANGSVLYIGAGTLATGTTSDGMTPSVNGGISELKINSGGTGYEIRIHRGSAGYRTARAVIQYYAV